MSGTRTVEGGCHCGAVRYRCDRDASIGANHCHCRDCQRSTGSGFATFFGIPKDALEIVSGELRSFAVGGQSGNAVTRFFCPDCGSPIMSRADVVPSLLFVKAASLDDPSWVEPKSSYWTSSAQPWAPPSTRIPGHERNPG